ncbi:hypothetical protein OTU49_000035 [Cherax quadricarinatus]|uniref:Dixin n=1 Tax=Cherax quadricarinatus TaxID=27406 RepID=A0AAW0XMU1_CHEQU
MDACRVLAHLLLERKNKNRAARQHPAGVGGSRGRLYRSEPAIHALGEDLLPRPLNNTTSRGLSSSVDNDAPPLPSSRPPPPPSHPPPPVPPHGQHLPQPPQQPLPPVPGHRQDENMYQQELLPQAPGTCTLPRRGMVREDPNVRFRSPSNPPPASRQPPPYSRHQPPDPLRRPRGPYQPPPPPKMDVREPRERDKQELHGCREPRDIDLRDIRNSRNLEDTRERDFRELKDPKERDSRDQWEGRNFRGSHEHRNQQDIKDARDSTHFREIRESWERRNSSVPQPHEDLTSSSLPRPSYESWAPKNNRWSVRDLDSGFDSLSTPAMENGPHSLDAPAGRNGQLVAADVPYSQSTEDLLNASRTSPVSISSTTTSTSSVSSSPVQYPTIRPAKQPCVTGSSHTHPSPHNSPHTHPSPHNSPHTHPTPHNSPHPHPSPHNSPHTHPSPHNSPHTHPPPHNSPHTHPSHTHPSQSSPHIHLSRSSPHTHPSRSSPHIHPSNSSQNTHPSRSSPHSHPSPHSSPHPTSGSPRGLSTSQYTMPVGPPRPASPDGALLSDSVYPQDTQPRYAEIPDLPETRKNEERLNHRLSRDFRDIRDNRELREGRETKRDPRDLKDTRHSSEPRNNKDARLSREFRDTSLPRDIRDNRDSRAYMEVREETFAHDGETRGFRELSVDVEEHEVLESRQERIQGRRESRLYNGERGEAAKGFISESSNLLRVRDAPSHDCRDRDADGADGLQVTEERRALHLREGGSQQDAVRRGDGCTAASSVSWMEWTQQLQAYVAWVNSQLRKRGRPLISDLRRDLQNGVVFADLIEIISGERVAGVSREVEGAAPQVARENLERILQFMAAKRIRMTHITSKEVAEGNLKSIMRIILALAAHYKPQSVKAASPHQQPETSAPRPSTQPTTHDVGVGPDAPTAASDKTPNLSANRRALVTGGGEDPGGVMGLRRHPSMTAAPATPLDSCPVYENLPRRVAPTRWAYDSLRASHKFQWSGPTDCPSGPNKGGLDESCDDPMTTSLNTSVEGDGEVSSRREASGTRNTRPAALNFWQDLTTRQDTKTPSDSHPPPPPSQPPPDDPDNPFRYHTIHRMSGRRKLPQIPGAATPSSRVTTPQEGQESPRGPGERPGGGGVGEEGSREPEGRSQNSSPATSLVRGPTMDQWSREKNPMEPWEHDNLKSVLRDLNNTRDQLLALQNLEVETTSSRVGQTLHPSELVEATTASVKQELLHLSLARQALEADKLELTRLLEQREGIITELRKQMYQRDKTIQAQRAQYEEVIKNVQNGKRVVGGECPAGGRSAVSSATKEELQLVRDAIVSLRSNFRETDPNQHTLDTLEQAIAILIERGSNGGNGGSGGSSDKASRPGDKRPSVNGVGEPCTKVIYFTERTVTPFMSTINKRLGEIRLRDFKNMFDRPGLFRFHFKSYDPEYGLVKEEIVYEDDILPGVDGKIIAWVEEDID